MMKWVTARPLIVSAQVDLSRARGRSVGHLAGIIDWRGGTPGMRLLGDPAN